MEAQIPFMPVNGYDVLPFLSPVLNFLHPGHSEAFRCGPEIGDLLSVELDSLESCQGMIAGPSCPPWSSLGLLEGEEDPRSSVFARLLDWIRHLDGQGLWWAIIENVPGICKKYRGKPAFIDYIKKYLETHLPNWKLHVWHLQCWDYCLPQARARVFLVLIKKDLLTAIGVDELEKPKRRQAVRLTDFLEFNASGLAYEEVPPASAHQRQNLEAYLKYFQDHLDTLPADLRAASKCAVVSLDRNPKNAFGAFYDLEACLTLTCGNRYLYVIADGLPSSLVPPRGRWLTIRERCKVAGVAPESLEMLTDQQAMHVLGNTIPVDMMGCVLMQVQDAWARFEGLALACPRRLGFNDVEMAWLALAAEHQAQNDAQTTSGAVTKRRKLGRHVSGVSFYAVASLEGRPAKAAPDTLAELAKFRVGRRRLQRKKPKEADCVEEST